MALRFIMVTVYPIIDICSVVFIKEIKQSVRAGRWDITTTHVKAEAADFGGQFFIVLDWLKENAGTGKFVIDDDYEKVSFAFTPVMEAKYAFDESTMEIPLPRWFLNRVIN